MEISTANAVWIATALLHIENPTRKSFRIGEIFSKVNSLGVLNVAPETIKMHISSHCVADGKKSPDTHRKLKRVGMGWYRLYLEGEECHKDRKSGKTAPLKESIPNKYRNLVDWYYKEYPKILQNSKSSIIQTIEEEYETKGKENKQYSQIMEGNMIKVPNNILKQINTKVGDHLAFVVDGNNVILKKAKINVQIIE